jgi:putative holliday junction resolvase
LSRAVRVLAVDWGERRIGLAVSDPREVIASGLETLRVRSAAQGVQDVVRVARETEADCVVVGLPLLMGGGRGTAAAAAQRFADQVREQSGLPVETYDERLTSALSERRLHETGVRVGHSKERVDQGAAVALLESFLARLRARRAREEAP